MRNGIVALTALVAMTASAAPADAQQTGEPCDLLPNPTRTLNISNQGTPAESWFITEAVLVCPGGRRIVADTATYSLAASQITLNGDVEVDDIDRSLRSEFAQYFTESGQLHARTDVVLRETRNGSVIMSELLDIYQETPERESLLIATGGRPRAIMYEQAETPAGAEPLMAEPAIEEIVAGAPRDSTILDAQEIRITGGQSFRGTGNAVLLRDSLTATAQAIEFNDSTRRMDLMGSAVVQLPTQELRGDTITATVDASDQIDEVLAMHNASLQAEDLNVTAPAIRLMFADGGIERLVAM
ncbi:MAG TPA: hypothetical protein VHG09_05680, partial [Longimicrobiales bacterium]|nr:hypothetical protein [Longimicrobiales bacterium]